MAGIIDLAGPAIGAGSDTLQGHYNRQQQTSNIKRGVAENKRMAEYQWNQELDLWNKSNEYNSPKSQMARLKEAGLNPNLVYGNGIKNVGNSQLPKYNSPTADYSQVPANQTASNIGSLMDRYLDQKTKAANIDATNASIKLAGTENLKKARESFHELSKQGLTQSKHRALSQQNTMRQDLMNNNLGQYNFQINQMKVDRMYQDILKTSEDMKLKRKSNKYWEQMKGLNAIKAIMGIFR